MLKLVRAAGANGVNPCRPNETAREAARHGVKRRLGARAASGLLEVYAPVQPLLGTLPAGFAGSQIDESNRASSARRMGHHLHEGSETFALIQTVIIPCSLPFT